MATEDLVEQLEPAKFRCCVGAAGSLCGKLFRSRKHTQKHIRNKHPYVYDARGGDRLVFGAYFNAYLQDPMRIAPTSSVRDVAIQPRRESREMSDMRCAREEPEPSVQFRRMTRRAFPSQRANYQDYDGAAQAPLELPY